MKSILVKRLRRLIRRGKLMFKDVLMEIPFQPDKKKKTPTIKKVSSNTNKEESSTVNEVKYIKNSIHEILVYLNGPSCDKDYHIRVTPTKPNCFRAIVYKKWNRKVLIDFFVKKNNESEIVFSPPLNVTSFTVNSYENRNSFKKSA